MCLYVCIDAGDDFNAATAAVAAAEEQTGIPLLVKKSHADKPQPHQPQMASLKPRAASHMLPNNTMQHEPLSALSTTSALLPHCVNSRPPTRSPTVRQTLSHSTPPHRTQVPSFLVHWSARAMAGSRKASRLSWLLSWSTSEPRVTSMDNEQAGFWLSQFIGRNLRIHASDGRIFGGQMKCTDKVSEFAAFRIP